MLISGELIASWHLDTLVEEANQTLQDVGKVREGGMPTSPQTEPRLQ